MKRIVNKNTNQTIWVGESYIVDGEPGIVNLPLVLVNEVDPGPPEYDSKTQYVVRTDALVENKWLASYEIKSLIPEVPEEISGARAKTILIKYNLYNQVVWAISQLPEPDRTQAAALFSFNERLKRHGKFVNAIMQIIPNHLTPSLVDQLFVEAKSLET